MWEHSNLPKSHESWLHLKHPYLKGWHLQTQQPLLLDQIHSPPRCLYQQVSFLKLLTAFLKNCRNRFYSKDLRSRPQLTPSVYLRCECLNWTTTQELFLKFLERQRFECHQFHRLKSLSQSLLQRRRFECLLQSE